MRGAMAKTTLREIGHSFGRYIAIFAIIALGVGFFAGLKATRPDMLETADRFISQYNFFDYHLISTLGYEQEDVEKIAQTEGVKTALGAYSADFITLDIDGSERVLKAHSLTPGINDPELLAGRMPTSPDECLADAQYLPESLIGQTLTLSATNDEDTFDEFLFDGYKVVGMMASPNYLNFERSNTSLGSGTVLGYIYIPMEGFDTEYYTEIYVKLTEGGYIYSDEYKANADIMETPLTDAAEACADRRYNDIMSEADEKITDAEAELADAKREYEEKKADAEQELADALEELRDGEREIADAEQELADGQAKLDVAIEAAREGDLSIKTAEAQLKMKEEATLAQLDGQNKTLKDNLAAAQAGKAQLQAAVDIAALNAARAQLELALSSDPTDTTLQTQLATVVANIDAYNTQLTKIDNDIAQINAGLALVESGYNELYTSIDDGEEQIREGKQELRDAWDKIADARIEIADGQKELEDAKTELADGWTEYYDGRAEADEKYADAEKEIADADKKLADARDDLAELEYPTVYALGRESNIGYVCFESDTNIVEGVSTVFPLFFFAVAALVCVTTMTRMVDEQRTQIGTLKALGYSRRTIMNKYMVYSGSAALLGCIGGFMLGCYYFPKVIWMAYSMMYDFSDNNLAFMLDWKMAAISLTVSLLCSVGATYLACRAELANVPAELIRPKAPKNGKRILLERIPFIWNRLRFLSKVSVRNVLRYRNRFIMMVLGIGGCTALVLTGFGIRDSIQNVISYQYDEITLYDYSVSFIQPRDETDIEAFTEKFAGITDGIFFLHESTVDASGESVTKSTNLIATDGSDISDFVDLHDGDTELAYPGLGEAVINRNLSNTLGLVAGDNLVVRDGDMNTLNLKITGVCDNYVFNYVFVTLDTCAQQWGELPDIKSAYINARPGDELHIIATSLLDGDSVSNVTVSEDTKARVDTMLSAINYIIVLIVACAGALAFIVLYNLTNINITERTREIATIKVLGFYAGETASYVFRENWALTAIGAAFGLLAGRWLHAFVMSKIQIDMMLFDVRIAPMSNLYAVVITFAFALIVDIFMYFKLKKINMAESLKSIE